MPLDKYKQLEQLINAMCDELEKEGLIPADRKNDFAKKFLEALSDAGITPYEALDRDSALYKNLPNLLLLSTHELDLSNTLKLLRDPDNTNMQEVKLELKQLLTQLKDKLALTPQKELLLKGFQQKIEELDVGKPTLINEMTSLVLKMLPTAKIKTSDEEDLTEKQQAEAIRGVTLGHDPRGAGMDVVLQYDAGNSMGLIELGALIGAFVSDRQANSRIDPNRLYDEQIEETALGAGIPILTPVFEKLEDSISKMEDRQQASMSPHPSGPA